jgi:hypothetical protein
MSEQTYRIRRFCADERHPWHRMIVKEMLTLEEAQRHCDDHSTHEMDERGNVVWFDGYERES